MPKLVSKVEHYTGSSNKYLRVGNGWSTRCEVNLLSAGLTRHQHNLARGGTPHDGIVYQQYVLALELLLHGVQLRTHTLLSKLLRRHDECAEDVSVLDKALYIWLLEGFRNT